MQFVADIIKSYINSEVMPQLAAIKESLKNLEKDFDRTIENYDSLTKKYDALNERVSKVEALSGNLEESLKIKLENHFLKQQISQGKLEDKS